MVKMKTHGGKREGARRPLKYGEATTTVAFRVPTSKAEAVRELVRKFLEVPLIDIL